MNRLVRGSVMLAATLVVLAACGGDPTADGADKPVEIVTDPSVLFVVNTDSQAVTVELHNQLGQQLAADFAVANVGAGIVVTRDDSFAVIDGNKPNPTKARFFVRPTDPSSLVSATFDIVAGGLTTTIPVKITPEKLAGVFSTLTPNIGDTLTLTAPAPITFTPASTLSLGGLDAPVLSVSPDGTTLTFIVPAGASGADTVTGLSLPYLSSAQTLVTTTTLAVSSTGNYTGTDDPATSAPAITAPASGTSILVFDAATLGGPDLAGDGGIAAAQYYRLIVPVDATVDMSLNWDGDADIDLILCDDTACSNPDFQAASGAQPEEGSYTLTAGTYYIEVEHFAGPAPAGISMTITTE